MSRSLWDLAADWPLISTSNLLMLTSTLWQTVAIRSTPSAVFPTHRHSGYGRTSLFSSWSVAVTMPGKSETRSTEHWHHPNRPQSLIRHGWVFKHTRMLTILLIAVHSRIPLVLELHPALPDTTGILRKHHPLLMLSETMIVGGFVLKQLFFCRNHEIWHVGTFCQSNQFESKTHLNFTS